MSKQSRKTSFEWLSDYNQRSSSYYHDCQDNITVRNMQLLVVISRLTVVVSLIYNIFMIFTYLNAIVQITYLAYIAFSIIFAYVVEIYKKRGDEFQSFSKIENLCYIYDAALYLFIVILSVFPSPGETGFFFPLFVLFIPCTFILRPIKIYTLTGFNILLYLFLGDMFKLDSTRMTDLVTTVTAFILMLVQNFIVSDLRMNDSHVQQILKSASIHDHLTGLYNKAETDRLCEKYIKERNDIESSEPYALWLMDLDDFKHINDTYGHLEGDRVLSEVGRTIQDNFTAYDVTGRIGGDEFMILMPSMSSEAQIKRTAAMLQRDISRIHLNDPTDHLMCSIGIVIIRKGQLQSVEYSHMADELLYDVKRNGKNNFMIKTI